MLRSQSDERLVDLVRAGNDRAFEAIVHRYRRPLLSYCGRFLTGARAEDALQQTFLNAYRALGSDERRIELRPWLYRIAHNAALNTLRAGAPAGEEPISEQIDGVERPDQAFERREKLADVVAAVQALPPRQRDALVLHELEGRSYDQIAAELQVSGGAVRQLLSRARTTLRAGATALVPEGFLIRLASGDGEPAAGRIAEIVATGGGAALVKVGTAVVVAGAVAAGAAQGPLGASDRGTQASDRPARQAAAVTAFPRGPGAGESTSTTRDATSGTASDGRARRADAGRRARPTRGASEGRREHDGDDDGRSEPARDRREADHARSGPDDDDDHSGGSDRDGDDAGVAGEPDTSGPDDSTDSDGLDGGSSGVSNDPIVAVPAQDDPTDSSGPGSGSDDSR